MDIGDDFKFAKKEKKHPQAGVHQNVFVFADEASAFVGGIVVRLVAIQAGRAFRPALPPSGFLLLQHLKAW